MAFAAETEGKAKVSFKDRRRIFWIKNHKKIEDVTDKVAIGLIVGGIIVEAFLLGQMVGKQKFTEYGYSIGYLAGEVEGLRKAVDIASKIEGVTHA